MGSIPYPKVAYAELHKSEKRLETIFLLTFISFSSLFFFPLNYYLALGGGFEPPRNYVTTDKQSVMSTNSITLN